MTPLFKKLNFKNQKQIVVLNAPDTFRAAMEEIQSYCEMSDHLAVNKKLEFVLVFVTEKAMIQEHIISIYPLLDGDAILWFAYPKASSKKYTADFNRDKGWEALGEFNLEGVRQVAIDDDWSALRFRKSEFIKVLKRDKRRVLSKENN